MDEAGGGLAAAVLLVSGLLAAAVLVGLLARRVGLPLTVVLAVVGVTARAVGGDDVDLLQGERFEEVLLLVFLPALVFAAALGLSTRAFLRDLLPIAALASVALAVSAAVVGLVLAPVLDLPLEVALLFGVLISATDPVAVVAVFRRLGVPERLLTVVEGESLLNDGFAIVGAGVLLGVVTGGTVTAGSVAAELAGVVLGAMVVGAVLSLAVCALLPWLQPLPATALLVALAYGGFALAEEVFGVSGVVATVVSGCVVGLLAPQRASVEARRTWHGLWESLDWVANALLFLLLGLAVDARLLLTEAPAVLLALAVVLVARAVAVVPLLLVLERLFGVTRVGWRNEAVLVWGGLRGAVALALALALPEELEQRDLLVALTAGVVLGTLLVNATTVGWLVRRLGLTRPARTDRFLSEAARLTAVDAALAELAELGAEDDEGVARLRRARADALAELRRLDLSAAEQRAVVARRALAVQGRTVQRLSDDGLLVAGAARRLLHEVADRTDELEMGRAVDLSPGSGPPRLDRVVDAVLTALPSPPGQDREVLEADEAAARRVAAHRAERAVRALAELPGVDPGAVEEVAAGCRAAGRAAAERLSGASDEQADLMTRHAAAHALDDLVGTGVLPAATAEGVADRVDADLGRRRSRDR